MLVRAGLEGRCIVHCGVSLLWGWGFCHERCVGALGAL